MKEQLAENYVQHLYGNYGSKADRNQSKMDFLEGFQALHKVILDKVDDLTVSAEKIKNSTLQEQIFLTRDLHKIETEINILKQLVDEN